ncbi:MAG: UPF0182 family protein [Actinomycetota bacterium]
MSTISIPRRRRWPTYLVATVILGALILSALAGFVVEVLWYGEIHQSSVFWHTLWTKLMLGVLFGAVFFGLLYVNLVIARRLRPPVTVIPNPLDPIERVRDITEPYLRWLLPLGAAVLAIIVGLSVSGNWQAYLLWRNGGGISFGSPDALFHRDPAFYIFDLPWLRFLQGWLFSSLIGVTLLVAIAHVLWGGIRPQAPAFADKVTPAARAHLSVLLGLVMLVKAWGYWLGRFDLLTSKRGVVEGASYTEVKAQLPALNFLAIVAIICAVLFFLNIRLKQWSLPVVAVGLLAIVSVLLGTAYPAFVQQFKVKPNEQQLEAPYIADNIAATNVAFGLDTIEQQVRGDAAQALTAQQIRENRTTVSNIRLWKPSALQKNFAAFQRQREYYDFLDVDVDRYPIGVNGDPRVVMVSAREINPAGIPQAGVTWQNVHLAYTHGYGAVASLVNQATSEGQPVLTLKDVPVVGEPTMTQPRIYYGESGQGDFVVANANGEIDFEGSNESLPYNGIGGIPIENMFRRALFAWNFKDVNLLLSGQITDQSRLMIYRDIKERAAKVVPFLSFDSDPYLAIIDGEPKWILDAYTSTDQYPYSQSVSASAATDGLLSGSVNYVRNSVKVVVDAYDGTVTYYADLSEPIIQAWSNAYPGLFTDVTSAPDSLKAHFRYPENLFQIQAYQFANYHVTDPTAFYQRRDFWQISPDPTQPSTSTASGGTPPPMRPYYQLIKVPGGTIEQFQLVIPFVPAGRQNMVGWMSASSDPGPDYGHVTMFRLTQNIEGPQQVYARINNDPTFSSERTLLGQQGSEIAFGDFLVIPIDDSFLYVLPVYVQSTSGPQIFPELKRVIVVNGSSGDVSLGTTLADALSTATGGTIGEPGGNGGPPPDGTGGGTTDQQVQALLTQALQHFAAAQEALKTGDLALYQQELEQAQSLIEQANQLIAGQSTGGATGTPTPTPSASVSVSPSPSP